MKKGQKKFKCRELCFSILSQCHKAEPGAEVPQTLEPNIDLHLSPSKLFMTELYCEVL